MPSTEFLLQDFFEYRSVERLWPWTQRMYWYDPRLPFDDYLADIAYDIHKLKFLMNFCASQSIGFPTVVLDGAQIPIDFSFGKTNLDQREMRGFMARVAKPKLSRIQRWFEKSVGLGSISDPAELHSILTQSIQTFLETRTRAPSNRLPFTVRTTSMGSRVHYSPIYILDESNVFGSPTSPVHGHIRPGSYRFGVTQKGQTDPVFSTAHFEIPPQRKADLLEL